MAKVHLYINDLLHSFICIVDPQELFRKYSKVAKLKLCLRAWVIYLLRNADSSETSIRKREKDHRFKKTKGGPVFQKNVKCGDEKLIRM